MMCDVAQSEKQREGHVKLGAERSAAAPSPKTGHAKLKKEKEKKIRMPPEPL